MKYTPDYTIKAEGVNVPLLFNTWTLKRFCAKHDMDIEDMLGRLKNDQVDTLLATAHESYCKYNNEAFEQPEEHIACSWVDALGGYSGKEMQEVLWVFMAKATGRTVKELKKQVELNVQALAGQEEKKATAVQG